VVAFEHVEGDSQAQRSRRDQAAGRDEAVRAIPKM
jgi:hypothetical protein